MDSIAILKRAQTFIGALRMAGYDPADPVDREAAQVMSHVLYREGEKEEDRSAAVSVDPVKGD